MTASTLARPARGHQVSVRGVTKDYGATRALASVDFDVSPGEFLVLLGPSGSGKSTLIRSLAGVERLDAGELHLSGQLVADGRRHLSPERRDLAMVFQDYALWPHLSVADNVGYALRRRKLAATDHRNAVAGCLERVGLTRHAKKYPSELSGGEQQRVALARALVAEPGLLLFDEPLSNLDADLRERLRVEISTLTRDCGATAVYITHDQSEAFALADRIGVLDRGRLVQVGHPEEIYRRPATPFVARFTGTTGEFPGVALGVDADGTAAVKVDSAVLRARTSEAVAAGASVTVLVRPAATSIRAGAPLGSRQATDEHGVLTGVVGDVAYRGCGYDHVVVCPAGTLAGVHSSTAHPRGSRVNVTLDPDGTLAYNTREPVEGHAVTLTAVTIGKPEAALAGSAPTRRNS